MVLALLSNIVIILVFNVYFRFEMLLKGTFESRVRIIIY